MGGTRGGRPPTGRDGPPVDDDLAIGDRRHAADLREIAERSDGDVDPFSIDLDHEVPLPAPANRVQRRAGRGLPVTHGADDGGGT